MTNPIRRALSGGRLAPLAYLSILALAVFGMAAQASAAGEVPVPVSSCSVSEVNGQAEVTWIPGPGADGNVDRYVVHRQTTANGPFIWRAAPRVPTTSYTDSSALTPTTVYRITAKFETLTSARIVCSSAPANSAPVPVSSCSVSEVNGQAAVTWTPGPGADGNVDRYVVHRQTTANGPFAWRAVRAVPNTSYTDTTGLSADITYRVTAKLAAESAPSVICGTAPTNPVGRKLLAVGDLNHCDSGRSPGAAAVSSMLGEQRYVNRRVLILGDIAYPGGTVAEFNCFHNTFGAHKGRMLPTPGNHEYGIGAVEATPAAYIDYFRNRNSFATGYGPKRRVSFASRSDFDELYYEVTGIDGWQILVLNSNCFKPSVDTDGNGSLDSNSCDEGSPQYNWVRDKITAAGTNVCRAVAWHHPLWRTPKAGDPLFTQTNQLEMMQLLSDTGTDLILAGHAHKYERFFPQDVNGNLDADGFQLFTIGTGGTALNPAEDPQVIAANSARRIYAHGLSEFTFSAGSYSWTFETTTGAIADQGQRDCSQKSLPG